MTTSTASIDKHKTYIYGAWAVLMALTAISWKVGADHEIAGLGRDFAMISILVLTFAKIYVVGHAFMELREAAPWLTRTFTLWCVGVCGILVGMYMMI